jgi:predicted RNA-binding Zn-ribbon protein involved in translation (DUF1610 family)
MDKRTLAKIPVQEATAEMIDTAKRILNTDINFLVNGIFENEILLLHFFPCSQLAEGSTKAEFRTFITMDDYITQQLNCQPRKWRTGALENLIEQTYVSDTNPRWIFWKQKVMAADNETINAIQMICGKDAVWVEAIENHQKRIQSERLANKHDVVIARIDAKMALVPEIPSDFEEWLELTAFAKKRYIFYHYKNGAKKQKGICHACRANLELVKPRHNQTGICPNCGKTIIFLADRKKEEVYDQVQAAILQTIPGGFIMRGFDVKRFVRPYCKPKFSVHEKYRTFYEGNEETWFSFGKFLSTQNFRWCENKGEYQQMRAVLYDRNLHNAIAGTKYQYCAIERFATHEEGFKFCVSKYLQKFNEHPCLEYFVKLGLFALANDAFTTCMINIINWNGKTLCEILGLSKQHVKIAKEINADEYDICCLQRFAEHNYPITKELMLYVKSAFKENADIAAKLSKYSTVHKIAQYLQQKMQFNDFNYTLIMWRDYVNACEKLNYDLHSEFVLFPKNLKKSHDLAVKRENALNEQQRKKQLRETSKKMAAYFDGLQKTYGYESEQFSILSPRNLVEIVTEGHKLHHCVGQYAENVADKKTIILFLRKKGRERDPFYTMEIWNGTMRQCRGRCNLDMTEDVKDFVRLFEKDVLQKLRKAE